MMHCYKKEMHLKQKRGKYIALSVSNKSNLQCQPGEGNEQIQGLP